MHITSPTGAEMEYVFNNAYNDLNRAYHRLRIVIGLTIFLPLENFCARCSASAVFCDRDACERDGSFLRRAPLQSVTHGWQSYMGWHVYDVVNEPTCRVGDDTKRTVAPDILRHWRL